MVGGLWATCLDRPLTEGEEARLLEFLPPERRQRLLRLPRREQRREPLCAYRLLTLALERECGWSTLPPMAHTPLGKPYFPDFPKVAFSISHTEGAVLVGVSGQAIGVDIERLRPVAPALLDRFGAGTAEAFFQSWVRREARAKRTGTPVELGATVEVKFAENTEPDNGLSSANGDWAEDPEQKDQTQPQTGN